MSSRQHHILPDIPKPISLHRFRMTQPPLHTLGIHANHLSKSCNDERMQTILQWVGVGSVIMMGAAATIGLFKEVFRAAKPEHRELRERLDRHYEDQERGR